MNPVPTFLEKMSRHDSIAVAAARALLSLAENKLSLVRSHIHEIAEFLSSRNPSMHGTVAEILTKINTNESLSIVIEDFKKLDSTRLMEKTDGWPHLGGQILYAFYEDERDIAIHQQIVQLAVNVAIGKGRYPDVIRADAMQVLRYNTDEDDVRGKIMFPRSLYDAANELSGNSNTEIAESGLELLAHISHRIKNAPDVSVRRINFSTTDVRQIIRLNGANRFADVHHDDFEHIVGLLFGQAGYNVTLTPSTGDFGVDVIATKSSTKIAIQVKRYNEKNSVGVKDLNQVLGGMRYYSCIKAMVVTTSKYTVAALQLAKKTGVVLWDWNMLLTQIEKVYGIPKSLFT
jgi:restriction system protein